jgi:TatD DNase family protein
MFVDSHAHIDGSEYDADREDVIQRAVDANVCLMLNVGTGDPHSGHLERAVGLANNHDQVYAAVGTHPHDARLYDDAAENRINKLISGEDRVLAWGEIGLDYHYDNSPRETQREVFRRQLHAAQQCEVPVIIHTREAETDTIAILRSEYRNSSRGGIMHCFGGTLELATQVIDLGFLISFSGNISFKKADDIRSVARQLPLDLLLIETDCPYLTPVPFRGKRNEPARVVEVARVLGEVRGLDADTIGTITSQNFLRFFNLPASLGTA